MKSTLISLHNTRFLCDHCLTNKYPGQPDKLQRERKILGCFTDYSEPIHKIDGIKYNRCIGNFHSDAAVNWIQFHEQWKVGAMPFSGNYFDQPAKAIEVMNIINNYKVNWELDRAKQSETKKSVRLQRGR